MLRKKAVNTQMKYCLGIFAMCISSQGGAGSEILNLLQWRTEKYVLVRHSNRPDLDATIFEKVQSSVEGLKL